MRQLKGSITTVFFDWDGTLLDSARPGHLAFHRTFEELGVMLSPEDYDRVYSPNWYMMYEALGLPRALWQRADEAWLRHYGEESPRLVDGAAETVQALAGRGYVLGIVSSGTECRVKREIASLDMSRIFHVVVCNENTVHKKPHPEGLHLAIRLVGSPLQACSYVGDSVDDIVMGKSAEILTIGVRSSYPGSERMIAACPDILVDSVRDILQYF